MRLGGVVFIFGLMLSFVALSASVGFAAYQLSEVTAAWDGTDADRLRAPSSEYDYTYGDEASFVYQLPWPFYFNGNPCNQITVHTNGRMWIGSSPIDAWNSDLSSYYYGGAFVQHKTDPERVVIEWQTETYEEEGFHLPNRFEVVLYRNGTIRFDYNSFMTAAGGDSGSGITAGSTTYSLTTAYGNVYTLAGRSFQFSGTPLITIDPGNFEVNFPDTYLGQETAPQVYTIQNIGGGNLIIGQIYLSLPPSIPTPQFRIISDTCSGQTLDPLATCNVRVVYHPTLTYGGAGYLKVPSNDSTKPLFQSFLLGGNILTTTPTVTITSPASGSTNNRTPLLAYTIADGSAATVTVDGTSVAKSSGQTLDTLSDGPHTVVVQSASPGTIPAVVNFIVDTVVPAVAINSPLDGLTNDRTPLLNYSVNDGTVAVKVDGISAGKTSGQELDPLTDGTHSIQVISTDAAGNSASAGVTIIVDATPPTLNLSTLPDQSNTRSRTLNISGTVADANPFQLTVNDQPMTVTNGGFSTAILLVKGANTITTAAADLAGNVTTDSRTVMYDDTGPVITLASPADGTYTKDSITTVSGTLDQQNATVTVSGIAATMDGINFTTTVNLFEGLNTIEVVATDIYGNASNQKRTITFDSINPHVAITVPPEDISTKLPQIPVSGTVSDADPVMTSSLFNGVTTPLTITNGTYGFSVDFSSLPQGTYPVAITVTDAAGNSSTATRTIIYDITAPALTIDPTPEQTSTADLVISGSVDVNAVVTVINPAMNTNETAATSNGSWTHTVSLIPGANLITVQAKDSAGNVATKTVSITYLLQAPELTIDPFVPITNVPQPIITGTVEAGAAVNVSVNGAQALQANVTGTTWNCRLDGLIQGLNTVSVTATKVGAYTATASMSFTFDSIAPTVTINPVTSPTGSSTQVFNGSNEAGAVVTVASDTGASIGEVSYPTGLTWACPVSNLAPGSNNFTVTATDSAGNRSSTSTTIYFSSTAALTVTFSGTGSGTVTSSPAGIACNTNCSATFQTGTQITLSPAASQYSLFKGWTDTNGVCSGTSNCTFTLNGNSSITAGFDKDTAHEVEIGGSYYTTIQGAYSVASDDTVIKLWGITYSESLDLNRSVRVTLKGGYDADYSEITGTTSINGTVTVTNGLVIVDGITIY